MFSNGSQPETGFPRRYKIAADVEFITSATIISSIRIILMDRIAFLAVQDSSISDIGCRSVCLSVGLSVGRSQVTIRA